MTTRTDTVRARLGTDPIDLVVVPADERDPGALVFGVPALCLVEAAADDKRGIFHDAGHPPRGGGYRSRRGLAAFLLGRGQDVGRRAWGRGTVSVSYTHLTLPTIYSV